MLVAFAVGLMLTAFGLPLWASILIVLGAWYFDILQNKS